jgi:hypothetical protein
MKKFVSFSVLLCFMSSIRCLAQEINLPADSITTLLCKKFEVSYMLVGDAKVEPMPAAKMDFEFRKDKTFSITKSGDKSQTQGNWEYDKAKKMIKLVVNGVNRMKVIDLRVDRLTLKIDTKEATPDDPMEMTMVCKVKTE